MREIQSTDPRTRAERSYSDVGSDVGPAVGGSKRSTTRPHVLKRLGMLWLAGVGGQMAQATRLDASNVLGNMVPHTGLGQHTGLEPQKPLPRLGTRRHTALVPVPVPTPESHAFATPAWRDDVPQLNVFETFETFETSETFDNVKPSEAFEAIPQIDSTRRLLADTAPRRSRRGPMRRETQRYELVLSRYSEKLEWLRDIPDFWRLTIYNTGTNDTPVWADRPMEVIALENQKFGREGYAYAHHLSTRYATLADYTVFSQAAPFEHNPNFGSMLHHPAMLTLVQAMSTMFTDTIPPKVIRDRFSPDPWFRPDKFSLRTMDSLFFEDCCIYTAGLAYAARFNVTEGANLVNHLLTSIGLENYIPEASEVGVFPYGGMFGVAKRQIQQHPRDVYQRLVPKLLEHIQVGYIMERTWLILFGGKAFLE